MKRMHRLALAMLANARLFALVSPQAFAQQLGKQVLGGWTLVSVSNERDGKKVEQFGANPQGYMTYESNGRFTMQVYKSGLPKFAAKERPKATPAEAAAIVHNSIAYLGTY